MGKLQKIGAEAGAQDADRETALPLLAHAKTARFAFAATLPRRLTNHTLDASPYHPKACASAAAAAFFPLWRGSSLGFNKSIFITDKHSAGTRHALDTHTHALARRFASFYDSIFAFFFIIMILFSTLRLPRAMSASGLAVCANPQIQYAYSHGMPISPPIFLSTVQSANVCQNYRNLSLVEDAQTCSFQTQKSFSPHRHSS